MWRGKRERGRGGKRSGIVRYGMGKEKHGNMGRGQRERADDYGEDGVTEGR